VAAEPDLRKLIPPADWNPHGEAELADPVGTHARLRATCPVAGSTMWGGFYTLLRYDDVVAASKDPATFTATRQTVIPTSPRKGLPRLPLQKDPPESVRYRSGLNLFFKENRIRAMESALRARAETLATALVCADAPEFGTGFAAPFTVDALCILVGMDLSEAGELGRLSHDYVAAVQVGDLIAARYGSTSRLLH
jgi:cytochrome P450